MLEPRISIITLGVDDLGRASAFYEAMGLERNRKFPEGVAFFQMGGIILALWPREELEKDIGGEKWQRQGGIRLPGAEEPPLSANVALAYNTRTEAEVGEVLALAEKAGGRILKPAQRAFWGGMQGYFADTEGNLWEVAHNPDFPLDAEGRISLPE